MTNSVLITLCVFTLFLLRFPPYGLVRALRPLARWALVSRRFRPALEIAARGAEHAAAQEEAP